MKKSVQPMQRANVPSFDGNKSFNAHHSPAGAFMSFTCGHVGTGGGIGVEIGQPADQNIYIGVKSGDRRSRQAFRYLPFLRQSAFTSAAANFQVEQAKPGDVKLPSPQQCYDESEIKRHFGWATDTWTTPDLTFTIYTPFGSIPEPMADLTLLRDSVLPAVLATLTVDNRHANETKTAVFALDFPQSGTRLFRTTPDDSQFGVEGPAAATKLGFAWRREMGVLSA